MPDEIKQPTPTFVNRLTQTGRAQTTPKQLTTIFSDPNSFWARTVQWLRDNHYGNLPEVTTIRNVDVIKDIGIVFCHMGDDPLRHAANEKAMHRISHANPKPAVSVMVEIVLPGKTSYYAKYEGVLFDKLLKFDATNDNLNIFQKEAMWSIGAKWVFEHEGVTKCLFMDSDAAFQDNSFLYYISRELDTSAFVHPFAGAYYLDQPDMRPDRYAGDKIMYSCGYSDNSGVSNGETRNAPGLTFSCTKDFFFKVLEGHWPYSSLGSGDVTFWLFYKGFPVVRAFSKPYNFRLSDIAGVEFKKTGYARNIAIHHFHGMMSNRLYTTRVYLQNRFCTQPGSDVEEDDRGLLVWRNTRSGQVMREANLVMRRTNAEMLKKGKSLTVAQFKPLVSKIVANIYGKMPEVTIVTIFYKNTNDAKVNFLNWRKKLKEVCQTPYRLIVFTNQDIIPIDENEIHKPFRYAVMSCANEWNLVHAFSNDVPDDRPVLFISPAVTIRNPFFLPNIAKNTVFMARPFMKCNMINRATWDANILMFDNIKGLFDTFHAETIGKNTDRIPYNRFIEPAEFISAYCYKKDLDVCDIKEYIDYIYHNQVVSPNLQEVADFVLPTR